MIIKKFEEQVERFYNQPAIKKENRELTYGLLNEYANQIAHSIFATNTADGQVALLFEHGIDMIAALLGTLKATRTYVPLDMYYPQKRLLYILKNSETNLILTNTLNFPLAQELIQHSEQKITVLNIDTITDQIPNTPVKREATADKIAYILYTSGSTGKPKGVFQTHKNVLYYTRNWIQRFAITSADRMSLFTAFTHDGAVQDIFSALLSGACLFPYSLKGDGRIDGLYTLLGMEKITIWHSVPSLYRFFANTLFEKDHFENLRWVLLGGEPMREHDLQLFKALFPQACLANIYGQTESSVSTICCLTREGTFDNVVLGEPLDETEIFLVREDGNIVETMGVGEIALSSEYLAPGYWLDPESTGKIFTPDEELGRIYWTGDLGRMTAKGQIKMMGRKDFQVKVRGFRVETGEIETALLQHAAIKEAVVVAKPDGAGDNYLCAYLVAESTLNIDELRKYLTTELPDYMEPRYFITLAHMPLTATGKIDRQLLPAPEETAAVVAAYAPPTTATEEKVAAIWQEVLGIKKVGIHDNFIQLGGHSLLIVSICAKIHQQFDVELQLRDLFDNPTVNAQAGLIEHSSHSFFQPIEPAEEKEYYPVTSDQNRLFVLNRFAGIGATYNLTGIIPVAENINPEQLEQIFQKLIERHEVLRTSFREIAEFPVQIIHKKVAFHMSYIEAGSEVRAIVKDFVRPFDLNNAPLLRVCLVKLEHNKHLLLLDIHHIIADGLSLEILTDEYFQLDNGQELEAIKLRYRDYAEWEHRFLCSERFKKQAAYWQELFQGELPVLNLPLNYPRPAVQDFSGDILVFALDQDTAQQIQQLVQATGTSLYMVLLAMYYVFLYKYTGQEDIIIGSIHAGRNHVHLQNVVGMFVKTLPLRNQPTHHKTFVTFLQAVKQNTLKAFENQDYPFGQLVNQFALKENRNRNPLFDAAFFLQSRMSVAEKPAVSLALKGASYGYEMNTAKFDLTLEASERSDGILCSFLYCTGLFKRETIELMKERFVLLVADILKNHQKYLQDFDYTLSAEKEIIKLEKVEFDF